MQGTTIVLYAEREHQHKSENEVITQANFAGYLALSETKYLIAL